MISNELKLVLGYKNRASVISKKSELLEEVERLTQFLPLNASIPERCFHLDGGQKPVCTNGKEYKWVKNLSKYQVCGRATSCECARQNHSKSVSYGKSKESLDQKQKANEKRKQTVQSKYNVDYVSQSKEVQNKLKIDYKEKTGFDHPLKNPSVRESQTLTYLERTGFAHPLQNPETIKKVKETKISRYGENYTLFMNTKDFHSVMIDRYGTPNALKNSEINDRRKSTNLVRYGVSEVMKSPEILAKIKQSNYDKYGVFHPKQIGYSELDLKLVSDEEFFRTEYDRLGVVGLLTQYTVSKAVIRNKLVEYNIPRNMNLNIPETFIHEILLQYFDHSEIIVRDRTIIKPLELDIVIPKLKIAFEICGLYWHSEISGKGRSYHRRKMEESNNAGYRLITIFEDEIIKTPEIVKSKVISLIGKSSLTCFARQTTIKEISNKQANVFLQENHIQGHLNSKIYLGAFYETELVGVMSFSSTRIALGSKTSSSYELTRFAVTGKIPGLASKMFKSFVSRFNPTEVISYCDLRWGTGVVYSHMGFKKVHDGIPNYWYMTSKHDRRLHRYNFRKSLLVEQGSDPKLSEWQIMQELGYDRIWDCGHSKWVWTKK